MLGLRLSRRRNWWGLVHNHFDKYLNVKGLIERFRPRHIVECGALNGDNTKLLKALSTEIPFRLTVITDNDFSMDSVDVIRGISYKTLAELEDDSIDMCLIDTDHNYWTLAKELHALDSKLRQGGLVILHDVDTFYHDTGVAESYANGEEYPIKMIEEYGRNFGSLGTALIDWLSLQRLHYKLIRYVDDSHGAAAIRKVQVTGFSYYKPAEKLEGMCQI